MMVLLTRIASGKIALDRSDVSFVFRVFLWLVCVLAFSSPLVSQGQDAESSNSDTAAKQSVEFQAESTVGMAAKLEALVLPGSELVAKEIEDRHQPFVLRIIDTYKHGTDHRYDMEFYALEPGSYNVSDYLVRADESATGDLPAIWVNVVSTLPAGQITPNEPLNAKIPQLGGYWLLWIIGGVAWLAGLISLVMMGRRKSTQQIVTTQARVSMAEHLRPLVEAAIRGQLDAGGRAELERSLIAYWCKRLGLQGLEPGEVMRRLRQDEQAGPLITSLEDWLHRPAPTEQEQTQKVDIEALLAPYKNVSDAEFQQQTASINPNSSKLAMAGAGGSS